VTNWPKRTGDEDRLQEAHGKAAISGLDRWGMIISGICVIHCLALPIATALLPFLALGLPLEEWAHPVLLGIALPVTGIALLRGYLRHRLVRPAILGAIGLALIALGTLVGNDLKETLFTVMGASLVVVAHFLNWKRHHETQDMVP